MKLSPKILSLIITLLIANSSVITLEMSRRSSSRRMLSKTRTKWNESQWITYVTAFAEAYSDISFKTVLKNNSFTDKYGQEHRCTWNNISDYIADRSVGEVKKTENNQNLSTHDKSIMVRAMNTWTILNECRDVSFWEVIGNGLLIAGQWLLHFATGGVTYVLNVVRALYNGYKSYSYCASVILERDGFEDPKNLGYCTGYLAKTVTSLVSRRMRKKLRIGIKKFK